MTQPPPLQSFSSVNDVPQSSNQAPTTPPIPQQRPQIIFSADIYHRPLTSMPPVILMGEGKDNGNYFNASNRNSMPSSPIVEMPPSPAPSVMMYVEYPEEVTDDVNIVEIQSVEVRFRFKLEQTDTQSLFFLLLHLNMVLPVFGRHSAMFLLFCYFFYNFPLASCSISLRNRPFIFSYA